MPGIVLAEGIVEVTADAKGVPRQISKDITDGEGVTREAGAGVGRSVFGGVVAGWAAIGGAKIITDFFVGGVKGASDLAETLSKSNAIFGESAPLVEEFGNQASRQIGLSKEAAVSAAAGFGDMFTQLGFASDAAAGMSLKTLQMSADLGSFSNLDTADVADRISAAFRGEYDSLQAVIPNINAARVETEAMTATGKTSADQLTAQEKATAVLAIVQKDGAKAMGDFKRTADGAANSTKTATASLEDQQSKIGGLLLPAWTGFLGFLNDTAIPAFSTMVDWISQNTDTIGLLAGVIGIAALAYVGITTGMGIYTAFQIAQAAATGGLTFAQWALNAAMTANPIGLVVAGIALLVAGIIWVATQTTFFQDTWANVTSFIGTAWQWLWDSVLSPVFSFIGDAVTNIGTVFQWLLDFVIMPIVTGIMIYFGLWAGIITWLWDSVLWPMISAAGAGFQWLYDAVIAPIFTAIGAIFNWIYTAVVLPIITYIIAGVQAWGAIFNWLYNNVISPVFSAVGASFNWIWNNVVNPVISWITGAISSVGSTVNSVFGGIADFMGSAFQSALSVMRGPINGIIGLVNGAIAGLNTLSVTIPAWVPLVGGQTWGLSIPSIPMLARGSANAPDTFIAGENGPELITGAGGSRVYAADETRRRLGGGTAPTKVIVKQKVISTDPILGARQSAREVAKYMGI